MRAITVKQPWAWAIASGAKDVENRSKTLGPYRGQIAIHAGLRWSGRGERDSRIRAALAGQPREAVRTRRCGAVIAVAVLTDSHTPATGCCTSPWADLEYDHEPIGAHLILTDVTRLLQPVPCSGHLGLWTLPEHTALAVTQQLEASRVPV